MGEAFIVRRGGKAEEVLRTATPDINFVSKTFDEIVVTFKNNDAGEAEIYYGLTAPLTDTVTLATGTTSSNITFSGLAANTQFTVSAYALVTDPTTKKIKSEVVSTNITTDAPVYTAATGGTTEEYDDGGKRYKSHTFTSNGTFEVTTVGNGDRNQVDYLIIAGGGGGTSAGGAPGGGGGAGGYRTTFGTQGRLGTLDPKVVVSVASYGVTIGLGGVGAVTQNDNSTNGQNTSVSFPTTITAIGGGRGAFFDPDADGRPGGCGGGAGVSSSTSDVFPGGVGTANQGFDGGRGFGGGNGVRAPGGGGGAGEVGGEGLGTPGNKGGDGLSSVIRTGSAEFRAGGGGGARDSGESAGGLGGGTNGGSGNRANAPANSGSGGGGNSGLPGFNAGSGGSGIVIIRYEIAPTT
jgi:hypothetical protein